MSVIMVAQLLIVLDATVVTIALPTAQEALNISQANRQWALTALHAGLSAGFSSSVDGSPTTPAANARSSSG